MKLHTLTYLPRVNGMELAPYAIHCTGAVAKASSGHNPLPFWISDVVKNCGKDIAVKNYQPNIFSQPMPAAQSKISCKPCLTQLARQPHF
jgi:hypothetical protein